jgi:hypothetical protein
MSQPEGRASELQPIALPDNPSPAAEAERDALERLPIDPAPNSVKINLGRFCQVSWQAESSAPLFAFLSIVVLLIFGLLLAVCSIINSNISWIGDVFKFLGQAILTLVGAVVGAASASISSRRRRG